MSPPGDEREPDGPVDPTTGRDDATRQGSVRGGTTDPFGEVDDAGDRTAKRVPDSREEWRGDQEQGGPTRREETDRPSGWQVFVYDVLSSVLAVLVIGAYLFAISGVWPPLVAVESESMTPNMEVNDLVFVMEADRFPGPDAHGETGVVTAKVGREVGYRKFGGHGDVIVYERDGKGNQVPIIHRAMFWVEEGENWYDEANPDYIGSATECGDTPSEGLKNCPAPNAGFITKGDANGRYDQVSGLSGPVKPAWIVGTAELRVPGLGYIRLQSQAAPGNSTFAGRAGPG